MIPEMALAFEKSNENYMIEPHMEMLKEGVNFSNYFIIMLEACTYTFNIIKTKLTVAQVSS